MKYLKTFIFLVVLTLIEPNIIFAQELSSVMYKTDINSITFYIEENDLTENTSVPIYMSSDGQTYSLVDNLTLVTPSIEIPLEQCAKYYFKVYDDVLPYETSCINPPTNLGPNILYKMNTNSITFYISEEDDIEDLSIPIYMSPDNHTFSLAGTLTTENPSVDIPLEQCKTYYFEILDEVTSHTTTCNNPTPGPEEDDEQKPETPTPETDTEPDEDTQPENTSPTENTTNNTTNKTNPETGSFLPIISITTLFILGLGIIIHKKKIFN